MRKTFFGSALTALYTLFILALFSCRDLTLVERSYQRVLITDFSAPLRTSLPPYEGIPTSLTLRISGTISKPVILTVEQLGGSQGRYRIRRDTLLAGDYADKEFRGDHYGNEPLELLVTSADSTIGNLRDCLKIVN